MVPNGLPPIHSGNQQELRSTPPGSRVRLPLATATMPATMGWMAFDDVISGMDWRLQIVDLDPLRLTLEHDEEFGAALADSGPWTRRNEARSWIAISIRHLAGDIDKPFIRRLSLQPPKSKLGADTEAFLANLRRWITNTLRARITTHFDNSIHQWETDALRVSCTAESRETRQQFAAFTGLDQLVSTDAARKAIHFVNFRTAWHLSDKGDGIELMTDHLFAKLQSHRYSLDEALRARSLVARCVEVQIEDNARRIAAGQDVAPVTRTSIHDQIKIRFATDGVWGLIHLVLLRDRRRYNLDVPSILNEEAESLIQRQRPRLFAPWEG